MAARGDGGRSAVGLTVLGKAVDVPLAAAIALVAVYPLVLWPLRFYLPTELPQSGSELLEPRREVTQRARLPGDAVAAQLGARSTTLWATSIT